MNRPPARVAVIGGTALFAIALFMGYRATHPVNPRESISIYIVGIFATVVLLVAASSRLRGPNSGRIAAGALALALVIWVLWIVHHPGSFGGPIDNSSDRVELPPPPDPAPAPRDKPKAINPVEKMPKAAATK